MLSRDRVLQVAASSAPFAVSPDRAAGMLAESAAFDPGAGRNRIGEPNHLDPVQFAESIDGTDWPFGDALAHGAPAEMAAYKQAFEAVIDLAPRLLNPVDGGPDHPMADLDEAALTLWCAAWMAGIRAGAAYEHLRAAMVGPVSSCGRCHGGGWLWAGTPWRHHDDGSNAETCPDCGGRGTVPTPAPTLGLAAD